MPPIDLPKGYAWDWEDATVRVDVPPLEETERHVYEPVLTRADVEALAEAIRARILQLGGSQPAPRRVTLSHDERYGQPTIAKFRERLVAALEGKGLTLRVDTLPAARLASEGPETPAPTASEEPRSLKDIPWPPREPVVPGLEPSAPRGFDAAGETDHGPGTEFSDEPPPKPSEPGSPPMPRERAAPVSKRRLEKRKPQS